MCATAADSSSDPDVNLSESEQPPPLNQFDNYDTQDVYVFEANRLKSFARKWPHKNGKCTAKLLSQAGFHYQKSSGGAKDCVRCFVCCKELEGWEPQDDPWEEHLSHCPDCPFAKYHKLEVEYTTEEMLLVLKYRHANALKRSAQLTVQTYKEKAAKERLRILQLANIK